MKLKNVLKISLGFNKTELALVKLAECPASRCTRCTSVLVLILTKLQTLLNWVVSSTKGYYAVKEIEEISSISFAPFNYSLLFKENLYLFSLLNAFQANA